MTTKEKYELIDKSQVSEKLLTILQNMEKSSKNFTDEAVNSRVDSALDKIIEGFKAKKPEALRTITEAKKEVKKEKEKAIKKNEGKDFSDKKDTDDKTGLPKKDTLEERKEIIKKESETEKEARERAKKELEKEKEKAKDEIESQIEKLNRLILEDPALRGFNTGTAATGGGKSTPIIDAERKALPRGSRVSKKGWKNQYGASDGGRKYWENRENRSDRKSPEYETGKPYLAKGGNVYSSDDMYEITMVQDGIELDSKLIRARNKGEARMIFEDMYLDKYQDEFGEFEIKIELAKNKMADGGVVNTRQLNKKIKDWYIKTYPTDDLGKEINDKITFKGFWAYLSQGYDVYNVLEVHDSVVRERIFEKVSEIYGVDYDVIYKKWLRSNNYAQGGGIGFKNFGKTKGRFKLTYEDDGEKQSEIWSSLEEATSSARRYSSHKLGYTNVHIYDETGKEYFFAKGGVIKAKKISDLNYIEIFEKIPLGIGDTFATILPKNPEGGKIKYGLIINDIIDGQKSKNYFIIDLDDKYYSDERKSLKSTISSPYSYSVNDKFEAIDEGNHLLVISIEGTRKQGLIDLIYKTYINLRNKNVIMVGETDLPLYYPHRFRNDFNFVVFKGAISDLMSVAERIESSFYFEGAKLYKEPTPYIMRIIWNIPAILDFEDEVKTPATYIPIFEVADEIKPKTSKKYAEGGEVEGVDLFEDYDDQPEEVQAILANYDMEDNDYETMQNLKAELESIGYTMDFGLDAEPYDLRKIGQVGKSEFYAKGGMMADGGDVDFKEKMSKMRKSYANLEMLVKGKIASAIGIDDAIRIMGNDYAFHPFDLITSAVRSGLLELDEINRDLVYSALMEAENVTEDYRDSGEGIGSSDMTYFTKSVLDGAGYKTGFINNRLNRVDEDGNELVIDKYEMEF
jgi:hypothetical protein